jgi:hypothetical protein
MAGNQVQFNTQFVIGGQVSPSLAKAIGVTQNQLNQLVAKMQKTGQSAQHINSNLKLVAQQMNNAYSAATKFSNTMRRISEIAAGVTIGDTLVSGLRSAVDFAKQLGVEFTRFAHIGSQMSAQRELMVKGLGNILPGGNVALAQAMYEQEYRVAVKSPFQGKDLMQAVKRYIAAGATPGQAQWLANRSGDIVAGVGGGSPEMERAALVFGKILAAGHMSGQEGRELKDLGIPYEKVLEQILGTDSAGLERAQKNHGITSAVVFKMIESLTGPGGIFNKSMEKFAETFQGVETSVADVVQRFEADFGDIENDWTKLLMGFLGGPDIWNRVTEQMEIFHELSKGVMSFVTSLPSSAVFGQFEPAIKQLESTYKQAFDFIGQFFTMVEIPGQGNVSVLNASGEEKVRQAIDSAMHVFHQIGQFFDGVEKVADSVTHAWMFLDTKERQVEDWLAKHNLLNAFGLGSGKNMNVTSSDAVRNAQEHLNALVNAGASDDQITQAKQDLIEAEKRQREESDRVQESMELLKRQADLAAAALSRLGLSAGGPGNPLGGNYGLHGGLSDVDNAVYYEHDYEGHSSQYGPNGNRLGDGYGIGFGVDKQAQLGVHQGDWVRVRLNNGRTVVRQVNETSSRRHGIEFHSPARDESSYGSKVQSIEKTTPPVTINYHIQALDTTGIAEVLQRHGERIRRYLRDRDRDEVASSATA